MFFLKKKLVSGYFFWKSLANYYFWQNLITNLMKKLFFTLLVTSLIVSCSKDDDGGSKKDCFDCNLQGTTIKYCYEEGKDFYTVTILGQTTEMPLHGESWSEIKEGYQSLCD